MNKPTEKAEINNFKPRGRPFRRVDDKPKLDPKIQLNKISKFYLDSPSDKYNTYEMEAKFGTKGIKQITRHLLNTSKCILDVVNTRLTIVFTSSKIVLNSS